MLVLKVAVRHCGRSSGSLGDSKKAWGISGSGHEDLLVCERI